MAELPKSLRNFTLFADGVGYAGKIAEGTPPKVAIKTEEIGAGGMAAPVKVDTGVVEALEFEATIGEYNRALLGLFGQEDITYTLRAAQSAGGTDAETVIFQVRARLDEIDAGGWKHAQGKTECKVKFACRYLKLTIGAAVVWEIDPINMVRIINGVDQLAAQRAALGL